MEVDQNQYHDHDYISHRYFIVFIIFIWPIPEIWLSNKDNDF